MKPPGTTFDVPSSYLFQALVRGRASAASEARSQFFGPGVVLEADRAAARVLGGRFSLRLTILAVGMGGPA